MLGGGLGAHISSLAVRLYRAAASSVGSNCPFPRGLERFGLFWRMELGLGLERAGAAWRAVAGSIPGTPGGLGTPPGVATECGPQSKIQYHKIAR